MKRGFLVIITAPSGTGKSTVIKRFLKKHPDMVHSKSCTTRKVRSEVDAGDYHFMGAEVFEKMIAENKFAEWAEYCGNFYGTPREPLDDWLTKGKIVLLDLEVVGGTKLKELYGDDAVSIFLLPPSENELKRRLSSRGTDSEAAQQKRLKTALFEITYRDRYDFCVINDDLERACGEIHEIIRKKAGEI